LVLRWIYILICIFLNKNYDICNYENKLDRFIRVSSIPNQKKSRVIL
jgi:hypothetical protein